MHHKRHRPKSRRAGCLLCKPHKHQRVGKLKGSTAKNQRDYAAAQEEISHAMET